jgi:hypothetical protein
VCPGHENPDPPIPEAAISFHVGTREELIERGCFDPGFASYDEYHPKD